MQKKILNILKYILFLAIGILIFWWVYKDEPLDNYKSAFRNLNYFWIGVSVFLSLLSQLSRAARWNMLIKQLGYRPRLYNSFMSVLSLYFVNLLIPRAGEVFRCTLMSRYERVPFTKLVGTVFVERLADFVALIILALLILGSQLGVFIRFFNSNLDLESSVLNIFSLKNILIFVILTIVIIVAIFAFRSFVRSKGAGRGNRLLRRLKLLKYNFMQGINSIAGLERKWLFIGHTAFIFIMWLLMLYVVFLAFQPTEHLSLLTGMVTFLMSGLAMLAPVQGGIGPWHFMVYETLYIYGIDKADGKIFAFIAHGTTNLIYLVFGLLAIMAIPLVNKWLSK